MLESHFFYDTSNYLRPLDQVLVTDFFGSVSATEPTPQLSSAAGQGDVSPGGTTTHTGQPQRPQQHQQAPTAAPKNAAGTAALTAGGWLFESEAAGDDSSKALTFPGLKAGPAAEGGAAAAGVSGSIQSRARGSGLAAGVIDQSVYAGLAALVVIVGVAAFSQLQHGLSQ